MQSTPSPWVPVGWQLPQAWLEGSLTVSILLSFPADASCVYTERPVFLHSIVHLPSFLPSFLLSFLPSFLPFSSFFQKFLEGVLWEGCLLGSGGRQRDKEDLSSQGAWPAHRCDGRGPRACREGNQGLLLCLKPKGCPPEQTPGQKLRCGFILGGGPRK